MAKGFRSAYIDVARKACIGGYGSNAELAALFGRDEATIRNWRRAVPAFEDACAMSLMRANVMAANRAFERSLEDDASNRYWNDRRNPVFMPKSKHDHVSNGQTLKALLAEHGEMDMDEARERGLIIDADEYEDISGREGAQLEYDETEDHDEFDEDGRRLR